MLQISIAPIKLGPEEFACPICGKIMKQKYKMEVHIRVHTGEKPFRCSNCSYSSGDKSNYQRHMIQKHGYTKEFFVKIKTESNWFIYCKIYWSICSKKINLKLKFVKICYRIHMDQ